MSVKLTSLPMVGAACALALAAGGCGGSSKRLSTASRPGGQASTGASSGGSSALSTPAAGSAGAATGAPSRSGESAVSRASGRTGAAGPSGSASAIASPQRGAAGNSSHLSSSGAVYTPFMAAADAICRSYRNSVASLNHAQGFAANEKEQPTLIADAQGAVTRLEALSPPPADAALFGQFTNKTAASIQLLEQAQARSTSTVESQGVAVEQQDYNAYEQAAQDAEAAAAAARKIGFRVCGSPGSDWF